MAMTTTRLSFYGAAGTVTGSSFLLETRGKKLLVDCGLFQGPKAHRLKNWDAFPYSPSEIDQVMLTHAHVDHIGLLPKLKKQGYEGHIRCTHATADLAKILLPDTGHLQEEEAKWANKKGYSKHHPAKPLFTRQDAEAVIPLLSGVHYGEHFAPVDHVRGQYRDAGHILGSAMLDLKSQRLQGERKLVFSGDVGRPLDAILQPPSQVYNVDYLVLESTYGNRLHEETEPVRELVRVINESMDRGGLLVIPAFAVGRTQTLLFLIRQLETAGKIPKVPVYVDSPMAVEALSAHKAHVPQLNLMARKLTVAGTRIFHPEKLKLSVTRDESIAINKVRRGAIVISASGMVTGGRILHHLNERLPNPDNTVLFIGYQAEGTRGRALMEGKPTIRMFGGNVPVNARIESISGFSGHADHDEILAWLMGFNRAPERVFLVHGESGATENMAELIRKRFGWDVTIPQQGDSFILDF